MNRQAIGRGIIDGTLVRIESTGNCSALTTYSRTYGKSQRFLILRDKMVDMQNGETRHDGDIYSFLSVSRNEADLSLRITWLNGSYERVYGHIENISIPFELWETHLRELTPVCHLHREDRKPVKLDFSSASRTIREICGKKQIKRAFLKGISRNFRWKYGKTVRFYNDGGCNFFFREGDRGLCGGFILHQDYRPKEPGWELSVHYSVHT